MPVTLRQLAPLSDDDLRDLSERNPGYQLERARDGRLVVTPTGGTSGLRSAEVLRQLSEWNRRTAGGIVFDRSTGFHLGDGSVLSPDAAWLSRGRCDALSPAQQEAFPPLAPDAVFEPCSQSNTIDELRGKMLAHLENGVLLAVLFDPYEGFAEVYRANRKPERVNGLRVALDLELPQLVVDISDL